MPSEEESIHEMLRAGGLHIGCYAGGEWRTWIPKSEYDTPRDCSDFRHVKSYDKGESILELLSLQRILMEKVPGGECPESMFHQITCALGVIEETLEYINALGRKPWRPQPLPPEDQLEELVDILHFVFELILRSQFSWWEVYEAYKVKHAINLKRYANGKAGDYSWNHRAEKKEL